MSFTHRLLGLLEAAILGATGQVFAAETRVMGNAVRVGQGQAAVSVELSKSSYPTSLGIELSEASLRGLSDGDESFELPIPAAVQTAPVQHIVLNWNHAGHIPPGIYTVPHFDLHFYMISEEERSKISCTGEDLARCQATVPAEFVPADYIAAPGGEEAGMGSHWVDPGFPEFHGGTFTRSFIYGFYDGKMNFLEPMFTVAYLKTHPNETVEIKQPQAFQKAGYYPKTYSIRYNAETKTFRISLDGLSYQSAPET
jgi:hypothetical protein